MRVNINTPTHSQTRRRMPGHEELHVNSLHSINKMSMYNINTHTHTWNMGCVNMRCCCWCRRRCCWCCCAMYVIYCAWNAWRACTHGAQQTCALKQEFPCCTFLHASSLARTTLYNYGYVYLCSLWRLCGRRLRRRQCTPVHRSPFKHIHTNTNIDTRRSPPPLHPIPFSVRHPMCAGTIITVRSQFKIIVCSCEWEIIDFDNLTAPWPLHI